MSKHKRSENSEYMSKRSVLCCFCFGSKRTENNSPETDFENNEPCEYVVEKLAIKKIPLRLLVTEDIDKSTKSTLSTGPPSVIGEKVNNSLVDKSSVNFASYYKMARSSKEYPTDHIIHSGPSSPIEEIMTPYRLAPKPIKPQDRETILISKVLNKHASLYTLDDKEVVPKDPLSPPKDTIVVPPHVQKALAKQQFPFHQSKVPIEIHTATMPPLKYPAYIPASKKDMSPEIKQTINALGFAQKPHLPGVQPRNQKSLAPIISNKMPEREMASRILGSNVERKFSNEITCHTLIPSEKIQKRLNERKITCLEAKPTTRTKYTEELLGTHMPKVPFETENNPSTFNIINSSDEVLTLPSFESIDSEELKSDQISEISQLKGPNLKWKIIIKHHSDKNNEDSENTDSETESIYYTNN